jgi:hypothetical protein
MPLAVTLPSGFTVTPSTNKVATTSNYVSSLNLSRPERHEELVGRYGSQRVSDDMYKIFGEPLPVAQTSYTHNEEEWIMENGVMSIATAPTSGQSEQTWTVAAGSLNSGQSTLRAGDIIMFSKGKQLALVSATNNAAIAGSTATSNGNEVKLIPYQAWAFVVGDNAAALDFAVVGRESPEGGRTPSEYLSPKVFEYTNNVMIIDDAYSATGTEMTNQMWIRVKGVDGKEGWVWSYKGELDTRNRFENYSEIMNMIGRPAAAAGTLAGRGYRGTRGYLQDLELYSGRFEGNFSSAAPDVDDLRTMVKHLNKYRGARENAFYVGIDLSNIIEKEIATDVAYFSSGQNFGAFDNNENTFVNLGFSAFKLSNYRFALKTYDLFNHPKVLGTNGMNYSYWGFVVPLQGAPDPKTGDMLPSLRVRYKALGSYSREMEHWLTGGANGVYTDNYDGVVFHYRCEKGFEGSHLNKHFLFKSTN